MNPLFSEAWEKACAHTRRWSGDGQREPSAVIEALGLALGLETCGELTAVPASVRNELGLAGAAAVTAARQRAMESAGEAREEWLLAVGLGEAALAVLGEPAARKGARAPVARTEPAVASGRGDLRHPTAKRLVAMVGGELDGVATGVAAMHVRGCASCRERVALLRRVGARASGGRADELRVAAAAAECVRSPAGGALVGKLVKAGVELVRFAAVGGAARLAAYADAAVPLRVEGPGLVTEAMRPGYWIGRTVGVAPMPRSVRVYVGDERRGQCVAIGPERRRSPRRAPPRRVKPRRAARRG